MTTDLYGLDASGLPPEYQAQYRAMQRQQMIAQSLLQQSQEPLSNQPPGVAVSPFQGLAKIAQAYMGAKAMRRGDEAFRGIADKVQGDRQAAIAKVQGALAPVPLPDASAGPPATMERPMDQRIAAVQEAMLSADPLVRSFGSTLNSNLLAQQTREDNQSHQAALLQDRLEDRKLQREMAIQEQQRREAVEAQNRAQLFQHQKELRSMMAAQGGGGNPYFTPVQTADGVFAFNARTGQAAPVVTGGRQIVGSSSDPNLQGTIAQSKESGKTLGKARTEAQLDLPSAVTKAQLASQQIDELLTHPGFSSAVGATIRPFASKVDGTPEADFTKRLDQIKGGAFLQAFETLKGGGQITEAEGKKATEAIARMDKAQSEKEFAVAAREFQRVINQGIANARIKAGGGSAPAASAPSIESLLEKYK